MNNDTAKPEVGYIYLLIDPDSNQVRYVGQTRNPILRMNQHLKDRPLRPTYKSNWIQSLLVAGKEPRMELIETCAIADLDQREEFWIAEHLALGCRLTNTINALHLSEPSEWSKRFKDEGFEYGIDPDWEIRTVQYRGQLFYSCVNFIENFAESKSNLRQYWFQVKQRLPEWAALLIIKLPFPGRNGKMCLTDCAPKSVINRIAMTLPSRKLETLRMALAKKIAKNSFPPRGYIHQDYTRLEFNLIEGMADNQLEEDPDSPWQELGYNAVD